MNGEYPSRPGYTLKKLNATALISDYIQNFVDVPKFLACCFGG